MRTNSAHSFQQRIHQLFLFLFPLVLLLFAGVSIYTNKIGLSAIIDAPFDVLLATGIGLLLLVVASLFAHAESIGQKIVFLVILLAVSACSLTFSTIGLRRGLRVRDEVAGLPVFRAKAFHDAQSRLEVEAGAIRGAALRQIRDTLTEIGASVQDLTANAEVRRERARQAARQITALERTLTNRTTSPEQETAARTEIARLRAIVRAGNLGAATIEHDLHELKERQAAAQSQARRWEDYAPSTGSAEAQDWNRLRTEYDRVVQMRAELPPDVQAQTSAPTPPDPPVTNADGQRFTTDRNPVLAEVESLHPRDPATRFAWLLAFLLDGPPILALMVWAPVRPLPDRLMALGRWMKRLRWAAEETGSVFRWGFSVLSALLWRTPRKYPTGIADAVDRLMMRLDTELRELALPEADLEVMRQEINSLRAEMQVEMAGVQERVLERFWRTVAQWLYRCDDGQMPQETRQRIEALLAEVEEEIAQKFGP
jgi:hypothetical protein